MEWSFWAGLHAKGIIGEICYFVLLPVYLVSLYVEYAMGILSYRWFVLKKCLFVFVRRDLFKFCYFEYSS